MDRLNKVHHAARVELPSSVISFDGVATPTERTPRRLPIIPRYLGIVGFVTCGAAVIATAGYLALSIH